MRRILASRLALDINDARNLVVVRLRQGGKNRSRLLCVNARRHDVALALGEQRLQNLGDLLRRLARAIDDLSKSLTFLASRIDGGKAQFLLLHKSHLIPWIFLHRRPRRKSCGFSPSHRQKALPCTAPSSPFISPWDRDSDRPLPAARPAARCRGCRSDGQRPGSHIGRHRP